MIKWLSFHFPTIKNILNKLLQTYKKVHDEHFVILRLKDVIYFFTADINRAYPDVLSNGNWL